MSAVFDADVLDESAAAEQYGAFGVSVPKLRRLRAEGRGPSFRKVGRVVTYDRADIEQWLTTCKVTPNQAEAVEQLSVAESLTRRRRRRG